MGISNEIFQTERDENATCQFATLPNSVVDPEGASPGAVLSSIERFSFFMRFSAAPVASTDTPGGTASISSGRTVFQNTGCALCHTQALQTGNSTVAALRNRSVPLYSDLLIHHMGPALADSVSQGEADGDEFRTAPLWGLGQRRFFLHDGRTGDLGQAILAHRSARGGGFPASEANAVINRFDTLNDTQKQDLFNFLRSL
jgi:CxxC motif-containing protein (DUF1111 family)